MAMGYCPLAKTTVTTLTEEALKTNFRYRVEKESAYTRISMCSTYTNGYCSKMYYGTHFLSSAFALARHKRTQTTTKKKSFIEDERKLTR